MKIEKILRPVTWLKNVPHGYACGYVGVPPEHPWHGKDYSDYANFPDIKVHGGITWASDELPGEDIIPLVGKYWWLGFDTNHSRDNQFNCDQTYCEQELESLYQQAVKAIPVL